MSPYYTPRPFPYNPSCMSLYPYRIPIIYPQNPRINNLYDWNNYNNNVISPPLKNLSSDKDVWEHYLSIGKLNTFSTTHPVTTYQEQDQTETTFRKLVKTQTKDALDLINHEDTCFSALFQLRNDIKEQVLFEGLSLRNQTALILVEDILSPKAEKYTIDFSSCDYIQSVHSVMKWIIETGSVHDGLSDDYDTVLDITSTFLIKVFQEKSILPTIAHMLFQRNRKGLLAHDLVWSFFEARDPQSFVLIADRLKSDHEKDVEFARKLLSFVPGIHKSSSVPMDQEYSRILSWIHDNSPFLHYTGEGPQQRNNPIPYVIVLEAKYLCKTLFKDTGKVLESLTHKDAHLLDAFSRLDIHHKILLSDFSFSLHQKNLLGWKTWLQYPITEQIQIAKSRIGGVS